MATSHDTSTTAATPTHCMKYGLHKDTLKQSLSHKLQSSLGRSSCIHTSCTPHHTHTTHVVEEAPTAPVEWGKQTPFLAIPRYAPTTECLYSQHQTHPGQHKKTPPTREGKLLCCCAFSMLAMLEMPVTEWCLCQCVLFLQCCVFTVCAVCGWDACDACNACSVAVAVSQL